MNTGLSLEDSCQTGYAKRRETFLTSYRVATCSVFMVSQVGRAAIRHVQSRVAVSFTVRMDKRGGLRAQAVRQEGHVVAGKAAMDGCSRIEICRSQRLPCCLFRLLLGHLNHWRKRCTIAT